MQRVNIYTAQGGVTVTTGGVSSTNAVMGVFPGATVTVFNQGTVVLSSIFSDNGVTPKANPFTSDATTGLAFFYAANGHYDIQFSGTGFTTFTLADVLLNDPAALVSPFTGIFISSTANPAATGVLRLASADQGPTWRNNANSGDLGFTKNASDVLNWPSAMTITGTLSLGANALTAGGFISGNPSPATTGTNRYANADTAKIRNAANNADLNLWSMSSNVLVLGDAGGVSFSGPLTLTGNMSITGNIAPSANATYKLGAVALGWKDLIAAGSPYFDIRAYGAVLDGTTDDTVAVQAALTAANTARGTVYIPPSANSCVIAGQLVLDDYIGVSIIGPSQIWPGFGTASLKFTGTTAPLISMQRSRGIRWSGLSIQATNTGMTTLFDTDHAVGADNVQLTFEHLSLTGAGSNAILLALNKATDIWINDVVFNAYKVAVRGAKDNTGYTNVVHIENSSFQAPGIAGATMIQNIATNWEVNNNAFEMLTNSPIIVGNAGGYTNAAVGFDFHNNFVGDDQSTGALNMFTFNANSVGIHFYGGNLISAVDAGRNTFTFGNNCKGIVIEGNDFASGSTFGTFLTIGTTTTIFVGPNAYGTIGTFLTGTPAVGSVVIDNTGLTKFFTNLQVTNIIGPAGGQLNIQDASGNSRFANTDVSGNIFLNAATNGAVLMNNNQFVINVGKVSTYNGIATVSNGQPVEYATVDLTAQTAAVGTTTLYAVPAAGAGQYRVVWDAKVTTAGSVSSTLGALTIVYTDPDGVAQTITAPATVAAGTIATTSTGNTTTTVLIGLPLTLNCKASTNITYAMAYAANAANSMAYNLHIKLEAM